ncbi:MAG: HNH endonuclease signature motif containing protein [Pseudohongiellaceae bacterium]
MTTRPWKICSWPGCNALTHDRHCDTHKPKAEAERQRYLAASRRAHDQRRPSSTARGYDAKWRRIRNRVLAGEPNCRVCGRVATEVDHITPLTRGGTHALSNLQPLCKSCHSKKTVREDGGWGRKPRKNR